MTNLRDKDQTVFQQINNGNNDTQKITEATTLSNREVNYCLQKLEQQGLIEVQKPDGMVTRIIDGQKRVFEHPKTAELTREGQKFSTDEKPEKYAEMSHDELAQRVLKLEQEIEELHNKIETFREQVQQNMMER
jgi:predicted transcriptional regulator